MSVPPALMFTDSLAFVGTASAPAGRHRLPGDQVEHAMVEHVMLKRVVIDESHG